MVDVINPIFVRGISRSGGTLMCTLLDAHGDIAMSYELYPNLLETESTVDLEAVATSMAVARRSGDIRACAPSTGFATFVLRCARGGLSYADVAELLRQLCREGRSLDEASGRMRLVELCGLEKMRRQGKMRWGMKCNNAYEDYLAVWPAAHFLNMVRDGRDVLASQLNTGSFNHSPRDVATGWQHTMRRFEQLIARGDVRARMVRYEALSADPEPELRSICNFLDLPFDPEMLQHHTLDLTVFKANHLSWDRITKKIDTTRIGRWRTDLSPEQLAEFVEVAGGDLQRHGYV